MLYHTQFSEMQRELLRCVFPILRRKLRVHDPIDIPEAIYFIVHTGSQWRMLPCGYPPWQTVYYHFRSWSEGDGLLHTLHVLVAIRRVSGVETPEPTVTVIDSQSVRTGVPQGVSGVDGGKKVQGIRRHIAVDGNGFPIDAWPTPANVHDSKGAGGYLCPGMNGAFRGCRRS
ncbi:MAG: transposase [Clostridiales bacterium]|nr:transposase [Clostridiales bacterium]